MSKDIHIKSSESMAGQQGLPAGDFSSWLHNTRRSLLIETGTAVNCGECNACCNSSQFIHIRPEEIYTLSRIRKDILVEAPGLPKGHALLGYDTNGFCPMLVDGKCSIYEHRPLTCRNYDCRVFTAAGITADSDKPRITQRVRSWKFSYPTECDQNEHLAVKAAAKFIQGHAECFPGGKIPRTPSQLAILAIKVYDVFLKNHKESDKAIAEAVVAASAKFEAQRRAPVLSSAQTKPNSKQGSQPRRREKR